MNHRVLSLLVLPVIAATAWFIHIRPATAGTVAIQKLDTIDFNRDIRPILSDNCYACHGPDKNKRKADLRLDTKEGLFGEVDGAFPVVPGKPSESDVFRRITTEDADDHMPPLKSNKKLTSRQVAIVKKWIEQGASWKGHWAYLPVARPPLPEADNANLIRNPIDRFVFARLKSERMHPAPPADKVTLIRRAYFDLIGLPPTPAQVDAFVTDTSAGAWEHVIIDLLNSPHYGERMAMAWLDQVRFADTIGYHSDNPRDITPYRDWVIDAFNRNEPFDQFTIDQLAGDLLPNATLQQKVASGYNRLLQTTEEGGAQPKEYAAKYLSDRVRNLSTVWLGATMGCCECHDHKFDPFTMRDFYSMEAFFADVKEAPVGRREAGLPVPTPEQSQELKRLADQIAVSEKQLKELSPELNASLATAQMEWEKKWTSDQQAGADWITLIPSQMKATGGATLKKDAEGTISVAGKNSPKENYIITATAPFKTVTGIQLEVFPDPTFNNGGPGRSENGNFVLTEFKISAAKSAAKEALKSPTPITMKSALSDHSQATFEVAKAIDGRADTGWAILPETGKPHWAVFLPAAPIGDEDKATLVITLEQQSVFPQHTIGRFRLSATAAPNPAAVSPLPSAIKAALSVALDKRDAKQKAAIATYYRTIAPVLDPLRTRIAQQTKSREDLLKQTRRSLITVAETPRPIRMLARGNWLDDSGDIVQPAVPHFLGQNDTGTTRATRLDLAKWLVSRENPLVARAFVNRLWMRFHGQGLSAKVDDLGAQGEWPTHPELLDWLAVEFMENHWDVKHLIKLILMSETYQQSSRPSRELADLDPANLLLAHQGRFRLDAEIVRDNALAISDLLVAKIGGESVKPYQPAGYWTFLNFPVRTWEADKGEGLYRRGLYTWWQRTFLHPSLLAFDAPTREEAVCERTRSNVPQQALTLLNDPSYVEAARSFARHIVKDGGSSTEDRLNWAYRKSLGRSPRSEESQVLSELFAKHLRDYTKDPAAATAVVTAEGATALKSEADIELAAWTSVARTILNLHETITRN